jgi:hypothetical protein
MNDREYDNAISTLPPDVQSELRRRHGISQDAAIALNRGQQEIKAGLDSLHTEVKNKLDSTLKLVVDLVSDMKAQLGEHGRCIESLQEKDEELEDRLNELARTVEGLRAAG